MSYYVIKYEFMGQDSAGLRGGDVQFQVFFEPLDLDRYRYPAAAGPDEPHAGRLPGGRWPDREGGPAQLARVVGGMRAAL